MIKEKTLDKETIDTYHEWIQQGIRNELNSIGLGPGKLPFRAAIGMVICGFCCFMVGLLLVALRMRHVYLWDWNAQFLGPFFFILFLLCISAATYLIILAKRRSNKYRSQLYFTPVGDWGVNCVHKSELARVEEFKHDLKSGTTPHKTIKPRSEAYSKSSKDVRTVRNGDGRDNRGYDRSPLDANKPFRPGDQRRGPPPDGRRGPPPDGRRGPPPDGRRGPPPDGRRGPPPDGRRGPPPDGRRGPPPDGRRGSPPEGRQGPPPEGRRGPPPDGRRGSPPPGGRRGSPPPGGRRGSPPPGGRKGSPPPGGREGSPPPGGRKGSPPPGGRRGSPPPDGRRGSPPPDGRRGSPPPRYGMRGSPPPRYGMRGSPPPNGRRGPPPDERSDYSDRPSDSESYSRPPNRGHGERRPPPRGDRMHVDDETGRRQRGHPRFGDVELIPDDERRNVRIINDSDRSREAESEI